MPSLAKLSGRLLLNRFALFVLFAATLPALAGEPSLRVSFDAPDSPATDEAASAPPFPASAEAADSTERLWSVRFDLQTDSVRLRWNPFPGAVRYFVEAAADPARIQRLWIGTTTEPEALIPLEGFDPKGPIYVRLQAVNAQAMEISSFVASSFLGRQTDLPSGISGITVTARQAKSSPAPATPPRRRSMIWGQPLFSQDYTVTSGTFGREKYNTYLVSHGLDIYGDGPSASVSSGVRFLFSANDREGLSLGRSDLNLSSYFTVGLKKIPATFAYSGYYYRYLGGGQLRSVNSFSAGYRATPRLTTGVQFTPDPRYLSLWGTYDLHNGDALSLYFTDGDFTNALTLSYHSQRALR